MNTSRLSRSALTLFSTIVLISLAHCKQRENTAHAKSLEIIHDQVVLERLAKRVKARLAFPISQWPGAIDVIATKCMRAWEEDFFPRDPDAPVAGGLYQEIPSLKIIFEDEKSVKILAQYANLLGSEAKVWDQETDKVYSVPICGGLRAE